jgi:hypothetical protein
MQRGTALDRADASQPVAAVAHAAHPCAASDGVVLSFGEVSTMNELLTLNVFAQSLPFAVIGVALFAGLIALPWWPRRRPHDAPAVHDAVIAQHVRVAPTLPMGAFHVRGGADQAAALGYDTAERATPSSPAFRPTDVEPVAIVIDRHIAPA